MHLVFLILLSDVGQHTATIKRIRAILFILKLYPVITLSGNDPCRYQEMGITIYLGMFI